MKINLLIIILLSSCGLLAQTADTSTRCRVQGNFVWGIPLGQLSAGNSPRFLAGQCRASAGAALLASIKLTGHITVGISFSDVVYNIDHNILSSQLKKTYSLPGYYTTTSANNVGYEVGNIAMEGSYTFTLPFAEVEPYLSMGPGFSKLGNAYYSYTIHRKKAGDNYSEDITANPIGGSTFFYPGLGVRASRKLWRMFYLSAGAQYNHGVSHYQIYEETTDYLNNRSSVTHAYSQPVSSLQIKAGIECRFRKWGHHKRPSIK